MSPYVIVYMNIVIYMIASIYHKILYFEYGVFTFYCKNILNMQKNGKNCRVNTHVSTM